MEHRFFFSVHFSISLPRFSFLFAFSRFSFSSPYFSYPFHFFFALFLLSLHSTSLHFHLTQHPIAFSILGWSPRAPSSPHQTTSLPLLTSFLHFDKTFRFHIADGSKAIDPQQGPLSLNNRQWRIVSPRTGLLPAPIPQQHLGSHLQLPHQYPDPATTS